MAGRSLIHVATAATLLAVVLPAAADDQQLVQFFADTYAQWAIAEGKAVGIGVGVAYKNQVFYTNAFGLADAATSTPFHTDTLFEIASNTKVFTTNLLGQEVFAGKLKLDDELSKFAPSLGSLKSPTGKVTLQELADFTGGFPKDVPLCKEGKKNDPPGCRPSELPTVLQYDASAFLDYFRNATPVSSLPAPYLYSNISIGLLGLLIPAAEANIPITDASLLGWLARISEQIETPLGMTHTYLTPPSSITPASGYSQALASAQVKNGQISSIEVVDPGKVYSATPKVTITGGGGSGATATATLNSAGGVAKIEILKGGSGYVAPPVVTFSGGGATKSATGVAIVQNGAVVAFDVTNGGDGYQTPPTVTIKGGRVGGQDAYATATIANGNVVAVFTNGQSGSGYVTPLSVVVAPGGARSNAVPIWAPAGALLSTVDDMTRFAAAAAGISPVQSMPVPKALSAGFEIAETPYACQAENPNVGECPFEADFSGLAWTIRPMDAFNGMPTVVKKNGLLPGFSSEIVVVPSRQLAVVVLINSDTTSPADTLALDIAHNLIYSLP
jgi:CubicO group peptidase (beta-lactamase class C family)